MRTLFLLCCILITNAVSANQTSMINPQFKRVKLQEFTAMTLDITPQAGTQLIFPFELDNPDLQPLLKIELTNPGGFEVPHESSQIKALLTGQNTITITGKTIPDKKVALGNLFISIGGYNLSIALRTAYDVRKHVSNIVFDITDAERNHLIENIINKRTEQLERNYQERVHKLDEEAENQSLKHVSLMATEKPDYDNFKIEDDIQLDQQRVVVFIDKLVKYGPTYSVLLFELDNRSNKDIRTSNIQIRALDDERDTPVQGSVNCPTILKSDSVVKCAFATNHGSALSQARELKLELITDRGTGTIIW